MTRAGRPRGTDSGIIRMTPAGGQRRPRSAYPHVPAFSDIPGGGATPLYDATVLGLAAEEVSAHNFGVRGLLVYVPTKSKHPERPRTRAAYYDPDEQAVIIRFREGAYYRYDGVSLPEWYTFRQEESAGEYVNAVLNKKSYYPVERL